jgi:hypothetical protein
MNHIHFDRLLCRFAVAVLFAGLSIPLAVSAPLSITIEPDNYADAQSLASVSPFVTLSTAVPPSNNPTFDVVAFTDGAGASTGTKVFAHGGGIPFWNTSRILRMDFNAAVTSISLDYTSSGFFDDRYAGRLEAYSAADILLASDDTALLAGGQHETMTLAAPDIKYALAYPPTDPFGDLDHLQFTVVPEPTACMLLLASTLTTLTGRRRNKSR